MLVYRTGRQGEEARANIRIPPYPPSIFFFGGGGIFSQLFFLFCSLFRHFLCSSLVRHFLFRFPLFFPIMFPPNVFRDFFDQISAPPPPLPPPKKNHRSPLRGGADGAPAPATLSIHP